VVLQNNFVNMLSVQTKAAALRNIALANPEATLMGKVAQG
jgi:hypothetical protein